MNILIVYGTRPEYLKIKPLFKEFDKVGIKYETLNTGQHRDLVTDDSPDFYQPMEKWGENRLNSVLINNLMSYDIYFDDKTHVLVQGDTSSVLGIALNAFHRKIKVIHLEAGLRTYDPNNPWPEEINRRLVSQIADIHLCPTEQALQNLIQEKVLGSMFVVGNTILDSLLKYKKDCEYQNKVLITLHRRENHEIMDKLFNQIEFIANLYSNIEFIFPMHPNPNVQKHKGLLKSPNIKVVKPMSHKKLVKLLVKVKMVITDSGGIQEEASFFNKICLVCRKTTERPEAIGQSTVLIRHYKDLASIFEILINDGYRIDWDCPFGDGTSAKQISEILK